MWWPMSPAPPPRRSRRSTRAAASTPPGTPRPVSDQQPRALSGDRLPARPPSARTVPKRIVAAIDAYQRRHRWLGFPLRRRLQVRRRPGPYLTALITYYGFLSLFPLLLLLVTSSVRAAGRSRTCRPGWSTRRSPSSRSSAASCARTCTRSRAAASHSRSGSWARSTAAWASPEPRRTRSTGPGRCRATSGRTRSHCACAACCSCSSSAPGCS